MKLIYVLIATCFTIMEGLFPWHWHGFVKRGKKEQKYREIRKSLTPLFVVREYFLNFSLAVVGWTTGYYLIFNIKVFDGDSVLIIAATIIFLLGATGYLPNFIVNRIGSLKG